MPDGTPATGIAIMFTGSNIKVHNVKFINCTGAGRGGAVFLQDNFNVTFDDCLFENNFAAGTARNTYDDDKNISGYPNVWLTGYGGAIAFDVNAHLGIIKNSKFINNTAVRLGGAISFGKGSFDGIITNSTFDDNTAYRSGGAISWDGTNGTMKDCNFTNNAALGTDINTALYPLTSLHNITNGTSLPEGNTHKIFVLIQYDGTKRANYTMYIYDTYINDWAAIEFTNETGPSAIDWVTDEYFGGNGGTIFWRGDNGLVDNCRFIDSNSARRGGGAYMTGSDNITFQNSYFENCTSGTNGGGLDWLAGANYGKVINCTFNNTRAARSAGAIYYDGDYGEMRNILVINTRSYGGTLKQSTYGRDTVNYAGWDASHWDTNTTGGDAGAIMFTGDHEYVYNATFINCTSQGRGGAVFLQENNNITFELCNFTGNEALGIATNTWNDDRSDENTTPVFKYTGHGGAVAFDLGASNCTIKSSDFTSNHARRDGGAINFAKGALNNTIEDTTFTNNYAGDDGGAINWEGDLGSIRNITCYNNTGKSANDPVTGVSTSNGGTICLTGSNVSISDSSFTLSTVLGTANENKDPRGGAIFLTGENTTISNSSFDECYCYDNGGAIYILGNHSVLKNCTFENCHSQENGGVLFIEGDYCQLHNSTFTNNIAGNDGGAIYWEGDNGIVYNITCLRNNAVSMNGHYSNGGTMAIEGNNITISRANISQSGALISGGAIFVTGNFINITDSSFDRCNVSMTQDPKTGKTYSTGGAAIYVLGDYSNIENSNFTRTHGKHGGIIYIQGHDVNVTNIITDFSYSSQEGGAIYVEGANAAISDSSFTRCNSTNSKAGTIYVKGVNATIKNSNISMTHAIGDGGAVYIEGNLALISDCFFAMTTSDIDGGAIYISGTDARLEGVTSTISTAKNGGAIYIKQGGNNAHISNANITKSSATVDGGAIYIYGNFAEISDSYINGTQARASSGFTDKNLGGAIYIQGTDAKVGATIVDAHAYDGGAIYIKQGGNKANISNSNISDSRATNMGGAIYIYGESAYVINSSFVNCSAKSVSGYVNNNQGGAIFIQGNHANITDSRFESNDARKGGAIYSVGAYSNVCNSNFTENEAEYDGGAIYWQGVTNTPSKFNTVDGCTFSRNVAYAKAASSGNTEGGGAVFWSTGGENGKVLNSNFYNNSVQTDGKSDGGAILWDQSSNGVIDNCIFYGNYVNSSMLKQDNNMYVQGGALYLRVKNNYTISNSLFENSWSIKEAGAVYLSVRGGSNPDGVRFYNVTFINNTAKGVGPDVQGGILKGGGAIFIKDTTTNFFFENVTFINNTAKQGAAISYYPTLDNDVIHFNKLTFIGNNATEDGAGIWYDSNKGTTKIELSNSVFMDGHATNNGGGIYSKFNIAYDNVTFINNTADKGGALYWAYNVDQIIEELVFINNSANQGGAIFLPHLDKSPTVRNNNFTGNDAVYGGAIYVEEYKAVITANNFTENTAVYGGAIYVPFVTDIEPIITISDSYFKENQAKYGGAVNLAASNQKNTNYNIKIIGSDFISNIANVNGGAVLLNGTYQQIDNCLFDGNNATGDGGAVYATSVALANILHSTFNNSHATNGGAIYKENSGTTSVKINYDIFINNNATRNGGAVLYIAKNKKYRDYNEFDGIAVIDYSTNRTNVTSVGDSPARFITDSIFYWDSNNDYKFMVYPDADPESTLIVVSVSNPHDADYDSTHFIINATDLNDTAWTKQFTEFHYNVDQGLLYMRLEGLKVNGNYTLSAGFEDENYMYKEYKTNATAGGSAIGEFALLQTHIENAIKYQRAHDPTAPAYIVNLTRIGGYTFTWDDFNKIYDEGCVNLTDIDKAIIIYGNGWRLDARGFSRIFNITSSNVTIAGVEFANGNASGIKWDKVDMGGAIFWAGKYGQLINSTVHSSSAERGGGIYFNASAVNSTIINTTFTENHADTFGGAIDCNASSMGLYNTLFLNNTADTGAALCREINATNGHGFNNTFRDNYALVNGSALAWINARNISIDHYYFYDNHVRNSGGAIFVGQGSENCEVKNCIFEGNYVDNDAEGHGGAIEWYSISGLVLNSSFIKNHAFHGGAIYVGDISQKINITNSTFRENYAHSEGGAISIEASTVTVDNSEFYDNYAINGGALYVGGEGNSNYVYSSIFEGNKANNGVGGAIDWVASSGTIQDTVLTSNYANYGGGIYFGGNAAESRIYNCNFTDNHARYKGGAIDCNSSAMYLTNTTFDNNWAQYGAALCREVNAKGGHGENNTFINNHAYISGAALGWMGSVNITITNYKFINNSADVTGGAIYLGPDSHNCSIIDCYFEDNYVTNKTNGASGFEWMWNETIPMEFAIEQYLDEYGNRSMINKTIMYESRTVFYYEYGDTEYVENFAVGGAVNILASNATIEDTEFIRNYARLGGAIFVGATSGHTIINRSSFGENEAFERGGAVNLHASGVHIDDSRFYDNLAINGSALYVGGAGTENKVHTSVFEGNNATGYGGGIYWVAYAGEIIDTNFTRNSAMYGGGIYLNGRSGNTNLTNVVFKSNNATKNGGAMDCNATNVGIYYLLFEDNYAGEYGAALCRESGATSGHGHHNVFNYNHAGIAGAGLAWLGVENININYYNFTGNTAVEHGGAIYVAEGSNFCVVNHSIFKGNNITNLTGIHTGGAIDINALNATIVNSIFENNNAVMGGAIAAGDNSGYTIINNVTFTRNGATLDGGAINLRAFGVSMNDTRYYYNTALRNGGAVYAGGSGNDNKVNNSVFENNRALGSADEGMTTGHGGAIDWRAGAGDIENTNFTANEAIYGGGIYLNGVSSHSSIVNVIFEGNRATKNGGAIDCNASMMGLSNTLFNSNYAGEYGAALCREANATGGFGGYNNFTNNHADIAGAALAWLGVDGININHYIFINNTADKSGGAIYVREDSPNCKVRNSTFDNNYVTDVRSGQGGSIDWLGDNGYIANSSFKNSFAVNGGTVFVGNESNNFTVLNSSFIASRAIGEGGSLVLYGDDVKIKNSNFTFSIALVRGGAIAAHNSNNAVIDNCLFNKSVGAGYVDESSIPYGDGGAIYWENSKNLNITNSRFEDTESHANGGAIYLMNCSDSRIYNTAFHGQIALHDGGSIYWVNSTNIVIEKCDFSAAASANGNGGGAIYLSGVDDATVCYVKFNNTSALWGNGGAIYVSGNATIHHGTFANYEAYEDYAGGIYFKDGHSIIYDLLMDGPDALWVGVLANVTISNVNITGTRPNKKTTYLIDEYDSRYNKYDYALWNDGTVSLDNNTFAYIIFNNGTILTNTTIKMLDNETWNVTWNDNFTFWATITDDNNNTIISVHTLWTYNDVYQDVAHSYPLPYNADVFQCIFQGDFHLNASDVGLPKAKVYFGGVRVKLPTNITITPSDLTLEEITFTAKIETPVNSNYTIQNQNVTFIIHYESEIHDDVIVNATIVDGVAQWKMATAEIVRNHMHIGTYTVTATYAGDNCHFNSTASMLLILESHPIHIEIDADDIYYGQTIVCNITSNATNTENGRISISINGKEIVSDIQLEKNGTKIVNLTYDQYKDVVDVPGEYTLAVTFAKGTYYATAVNFTAIEVKKLNATIDADPETPIVWGNPEVINVTIGKNETVGINVTGFVKIIVNGEDYIEEIKGGKVQFSIPNLAVGTYSDITVEYMGDYYYEPISTKGLCIRCKSR